MVQNYICGLPKAVSGRKTNFEYQIWNIESMSINVIYNLLPRAITRE